MSLLCASVHKGVMQSEDRRFLQTIVVVSATVGTLSLVAMVAAGMSDIVVKNDEDVGRTTTPLFVLNPEVTPEKANATLNELRVTEFSSSYYDALPESEKQAARTVAEAARLLNPLYWNQMWSRNLELHEFLEQSEGPGGFISGPPHLQLFCTMGGPWNDYTPPLVTQAPPHRPPGANFYPEDASKSDLEAWLRSLSGEEKKQAESYFTTIERRGDSFTSVPFTVAYRQWLIPAAALLRKASSQTTSESLRSYLTSLSMALETSNDYGPSDAQWIGLDSSLDITFGPYETYSDRVFGYKAAFEAYVGVRNTQENNAMAAFLGLLQTIENHLPEPAEWRNTQLQGTSTIVVVDLIYNAGEARNGIQTLAFNLPNNETTTKAHGSKRVMLFNVNRAKFELILVPISRHVLATQDIPHVNFGRFFRHVLCHELIHGLGPHTVQTGDNKDTTVHLALQDAYSAVEEAKADACGLWALGYLLVNNQLPDEEGDTEAAERSFYVTFLASAFRTLRFGTGDAHAVGQAMQLHWLLDHDGVYITTDQRFGVNQNTTHFRAAVTSLCGRLLWLQGTGDRAAALQWMQQASSWSDYPAVETALQRVADDQDISTDLRPSFPQVTEGDR